MSYHTRQASIQCLRTGLGLEAKGTDTATRRGMKEISATDAEGMDVRMEWNDGRIGRVKVTRDGSLEKAVVFGDKGRERRVEQLLVGGDGRIEGLRQRLMEL